MEEPISKSTDFPPHKNWSTQQGCIPTYLHSIHLHTRTAIFSQHDISTDAATLVHGPRHLLHDTCDVPNHTTCAHAEGADEATIDHGAKILDLLGRKKIALEHAESSYWHVKRKPNGKATAKKQHSEHARVRAVILHDEMLHVEKTARALSVLRGTMDIRKMTNECVGEAFPPSDKDKRDTKALLREMKHLQDVLGEGYAHLEREGVHVPHGDRKGNGMRGKDGAGVFLRAGSSHVSASTSMFGVNEAGTDASYSRSPESDGSHGADPSRSKRNGRFSRSISAHEPGHHSPNKLSIAQTASGASPTSSRRGNVAPNAPHNGKGTNGLTNTVGGANGSSHASVPHAYSNSAHVKQALTLLTEASLRDSAVVQVRKQCLVTRIGMSRYDYSAVHELAELLTAHANRISTVIMQQNWIMAQGMAILAPVLETLTTLTSLDLSSNDLRPHGAASLAPTLTNLYRLRALYLGCNHMQDEGLRALSTPLQALTRLECLDISKNKLTSAGADALSGFLSRAQLLKTLDISGNVTHYSFQSSDGPDLMAKLAPHLLKLAGLENLNVSSNFLFPLGAKYVCQFVMESAATLRHLNIGGTKCVRACVSYFISVRRLYVCWNLMPSCTTRNLCGCVQCPWWSA
jgi:Ran GTPase-activating protein (RanGAP) involved in mRNA processing and transport